MDRRGLIRAAGSALILPTIGSPALGRGRKIDEMAARFAQFPFSGALADFDFQRQIYFWGGARKRPSDFTSFVLGSGSIDQYGLLPASDTVIQVLTSGIGTIKSCVGRAIPISIPGTARRAFELHDGTINNRIMFQNNASAIHSAILTTGGVQQSSQAFTPITTLPFSVAQSWGTGSVKCVVGSVSQGLVWAPAENTSATIPTITTVQFGKGFPANTQYTGYLQRVILFGDQLDYPDLGLMAVGITARVS